MICPARRRPPSANRPPNKALQRTRVRPAGGRSPLSFETLDASRKGRWPGARGSQRGPHRHSVLQPAWPVPVERPAQEPPCPSGSAVCGQRKVQPVEQHPGPGVSWSHAPAHHLLASNPRMQRTRSARR